VNVKYVEAIYVDERRRVHPFLLCTCIEPISINTGSFYRMSQRHSLLGGLCQRLKHIHEFGVFQSFAECHWPPDPCVSCRQPSTLLCFTGSIWTHVGLRCGSSSGALASQTQALRQLREESSSSQRRRRITSERKGLAAILL